MSLEISIINHSNPELLLECLASIYKKTQRLQFDVTVVDNATGGRMVSEIRAAYPQVKWIFNQQRLGFSANHNQVLCRSTADYICILNDDTLVNEGCFERLVEHLELFTDVAICGPRILNPDGSIQDSTFNDQSLWTELVGVLTLPKALNRIKRANIHPAQFSDHPQDVPSLLGACLVVRNKALGEIGVLDEVLSPIANNEDVDWCLRARQAKWKVSFCPYASIMHYGGQSQKCEQTTANRFYVEMLRVRIAYFKKHHGILHAVVLRAIYLLSCPWNLLMLLQSAVRKRKIDKNSLSASRTIWELAKMSVTPNSWKMVEK